MASRDNARDAIYDAVEKIAKSATEDYSGTTASQMLRDAAHAYRAAYGGAQPGGVSVEKA